MDREKLMQLAKLVGELVGENEPTDAELDYDENAIELYAELHNLKEALENMGFDVE